MCFRVRQRRFLENPSQKRGFLAFRDLYLLSVTKVANAGARFQGFEFKTSQMKGIIRNSGRKRSSSLEHRNRRSQDRVLVDFLYKRSDGRGKHFPQAKPLTVGKWIMDRRTANRCTAPHNSRNHIITVSRQSLDKSRQVWTNVCAVELIQRIV